MTDIEIFIGVLSILTTLLIGMGMYFTARYTINLRVMCTLFGIFLFFIIYVVVVLWTYPA